MKKKFNYITFIKTFSGSTKIETKAKVSID